MRRFNSHFLRSGSSLSVLFLILSFFMLNASGQQKSDNMWYSNKLLRIYHPNMRNWEVKRFDVAKFVNDCASVNAEAIVVNAGGIYSYYPSKIEHHKPNPLLGGRDLFVPDK